MTLLFLQVRDICRKTPEVINIVDKTANSPIMLACQRGMCLGCLAWPLKGSRGIAPEGVQGSRP